MTHIASIGTYLPPWTARDRRVKGPDEDALTMAVAAGRAADPGATAQRVVLVSRDFPLLEGGNGAVLLAALSLAADVPVTETLGGAPVVLDQIASAGAGCSPRSGPPPDRSRPPDWKRPGMTQGSERVR